MAKALSVDLRQRVVDAVRDGMSRRQAAARFGVSPSSAVRWTAQAAATGEVAPRKRGGDRKSERIEAHAGHRRVMHAGNGDAENPTALLMVAAIHGAAGHQFERLQPAIDVLQAARGVAGPIDRNLIPPNGPPPPPGPPGPSPGPPGPPRLSVDFSKILRFLKLGRI